MGVSLKDPQDGDLALISQSGAISTALVEWAANRNVGFSSIVSMGENLDVDFGDLLDYFALDSNTRAILLYVESISDVRKFMSAARAAARVKPVVVIKSGRHTQGARAAATHTGALAGADAVYDAAFRRAGLLPERPGPAELKAPAGRAGIISGSCSTATRGQIKAALEAGFPALKVDPFALVEGSQDAAGLAAWALAQPADKPFLVYSSDDPAEVAAVQDKLGRERAGKTRHVALHPGAQGPDIESVGARDGAGADECVAWIAHVVIYCSPSPMRSSVSRSHTTRPVDSTRITPSRSSVLSSWLTRWREAPSSCASSSCAS